MPRSIQTSAQYQRERTRWEEYRQALQAGIPAIQHAGGAPPPPARPDTYSDRLAKYIPAEVVTLYLALVAAGAQAVGNPASVAWLNQNLGPDWQFWLNLVAFIAGLIATPLYLRFRLQVRSPVQILISVGSFVIWAVAIPDGLFKDWPPVIRGFLLPAYTFAVAFYEPRPNGNGQT